MVLKLKSSSRGPWKLKPCNNRRTKSELHVICRGVNVCLYSTLNGKLTPSQGTRHQDPLSQILGAPESVVDLSGCSSPVWVLKESSWTMTWLYKKKFVINKKSSIDQESGLPKEVVGPDVQKLNRKCSNITFLYTSLIRYARSPYFRDKEKIYDMFEMFLSTLF